MGFMNWLMKGAGFETEEVFDNSAQKQIQREEKQKLKEEKQRIKAENRALKVQKKAEKAKKKYSHELSSSQDSQTNTKQPPKSTVSYSENPDQYNMSRYEAPIGDYGVKSSNVGGYGTKNVEFLYPTKYDDVATVMANWFKDLKGENVCDVGCGTGKLILTYLDIIGKKNAINLIKNGKLFLYDIDETALSICKTILLTERVILRVTKVSPLNGDSWLNKIPLLACIP